MSNKRSTGKDQSDKIRNGEIDSRVDSPLRDIPHSTKIHNTKPTKINHERPLTSSNRHRQSEKPDNSRVKSSRSPGQNPPSAAQSRRVKSSQDGRTSIDVEASEVEQHRKTDDEEAESTSPKRTNENKTPSPATRLLSRPSQKEQGLERRFGGSNQQPYVLESDLRRGSNYYLYCLGKIYDVSDMRRRKEMQYWNLLARQRQLGFHSAKECEVYMRYLSRPRTADIYKTSPTHFSKSRTRSTEGRRGRGEEPGGRSGVASDGKGRTMAVNEEKDEKESSGDYKVKAVRSKTRPATSEPRSVSSKTRPVSSKTSEGRPANSKTGLVNSKTSKPNSKTRLDSSKEVDKRAADNQRSISRDEDEDEEKKKKGSNETSDDESETSENDEDKTRNRRNSPRGEDQRRTEDEQKSSDALTSKAAEAGNDGDEEETSDGDESEGNTQRDEGNKAVDARNRDGRNNEVASNDDGGSDSKAR